jgi:hypothetical protein
MGRQVVYANHVERLKAQCGVHRAVKGRQWQPEEGNKKEGRLLRLG